MRDKDIRAGIYSRMRRGYQKFGWSLLPALPALMRMAGDNDPLRLPVGIAYGGNKSIQIALVGWV